MPCDQIRTTGVELTNPHLDSLMKALSNLGLDPKLQQDGSIKFYGGTFKDGKLSMRSSDYTASDVREEYAKEIVKHATEKHGWAMKQVEVRTKGAIAAFKVTKKVTTSR